METEEKGGGLLFGFRKKREFKDEFQLGITSAPLLENASIPSSHLEKKNRTHLTITLLHAALYPFLILFLHTCYICFLTDH